MCVCDRGPMDPLTCIIMSYLKVTAYKKLLNSKTCIAYLIYLMVHDTRALDNIDINCAQAQRCQVDENADK